MPSAVTGITEAAKRELSAYHGRLMSNAALPAPANPPAARATSTASDTAISAAMASDGQRSATSLAPRKCTETASSAG
jgi:hypothetical protein